MADWYMVTVVGRDKPGIVSGMSQVLFDGGWSLGETSMARLGGNFTIMMMVGGEGSAADLDKILQPAATRLGLDVHVDSIKAELHRHAEPNVQIRVFCADRAGIVADVTGALADAGLHVLDLNSEISGTETEPVYVMVLDGFVEGGVDSLEAAVRKLNTKGLKVDLESMDVLLG
ncbi:MAG: glycine cleavage system protein R [Acidiferrobacterales bacterium]